MDITKYDPVIEDILRKLRVSRDQKEDFTQECYMALLENQSALDEARDPMNYAATLCRNQVIDLFRKKGREIPADSLDDPKVLHKAIRMSAPPLPDLDEEMMREAMKALTDDEWEVVRRLYIEGYSRVEVSAVLGIHANTVDNRARSGVEKLKSHFGER